MRAVLHAVAIAILPSWLLVCRCDGQEPIVVFAGQNDLVRVNKELERDPDILKKLNAKRRNILNAPCKWGHVEMVKLLLDHGADPNINVITFKEWPLHCAAEKGRAEITEMLLAKGVEVDVRDRQKSTPLHRAASHNQHRSIPLLIKAKADLEAKDRDGHTPLLNALVQGHENGRAAVLLLEAGAKHDTKAQGYYPIHFAAFHDIVPALECLLKKGDDIERKSDGGFTPLDVAARRGAANAVTFLLGKGAKATEDTVQLARGEGHEEAAKLVEQHLGKATDEKP